MMGSKYAKKRLVPNASYDYRGRGRESPLPNNTSKSMTSDVEDGCRYSAEQLEFMLAMERYTREQARPFPDCSDVLIVAKKLGYVKARSA